MANVIKAPSIGIPFPRTIDEPPSPSESASDANIFPAPVDTPTNMTGRKGDSQSSPEQTSLRWLSTSTANSRAGPSLSRVLSFCSTTTVSSAFQRTEDPSASGGDIASRGYKDPPVPPLSHERGMGGARSVLQLFKRPLSRKRSESLLSTSSPSLPTTPDFAAQTFPPISIVSESSPTLHYGRGGALSFQGLSEHSESVHKTVDSDVLLMNGKRHDGVVLQATPRLRHASSFAHLDKKHEPPFDSGADLTLSVLQSSRNLKVFDRDGFAVKFGDLWKDQRTCVIFIRHFWCPLCMDYTRSIVDQVRPDVLQKAGVRLVVISNGSPAMIKSYQGIFKFPFQMYTDPSLSVYRALGMTLRTLDGGPESERGKYVEHGTAAGIAMVLKNAVKARMPVHKNGGDIKQLGGEFVLGPGLRCSYASRMHNTRSHKPILDVLTAAGVYFDQDSVVDLESQELTDEDQWMNEREADLKRMRAKKGLRRGFKIERLSSESDDFEGGIDISHGDGIFHREY